MKKVMLYAYTNTNLGDDLFLKILCERYPQIEFWTFAPRKYDPFVKQYPNLKFIINDSLIYRIANKVSRTILKKELKTKYIKDIEATIYIGGSLFMEQNNWPALLELLKARKRKDTPFFLLGANFGPYENPKFLSMHKEEFGKYEDICFRDKKSYGLFKDLANTRMASDIVFQLKSEKNLIEIEENSVIISVIKPSIRTELKGLDNNYFENIRSIIKYYTSKGNKIYLVSFCEAEGDMEAIDKIKIGISENIDIVNYDGSNLSYVLNLFNNCGIVYATRFHAMILGWVNNKKVFPIVYSDKMINVINDCGFKGSFCDIRNENYYINFPIGDNQKLENVKILKEDSEKHFFKLDKLLNK